MKKQITSFYLESLLLVVLFTAILLVLMSVFSGAKVQSVQAERLTQAVLLAENAAEALAGSDSEESLQALLNENDNTRLDGNVLIVSHDGYEVNITLDRSGAMLYGDIRVTRNGQEIYALETAVCVREAVE